LQPSLNTRGQPEPCEILGDLQLDGDDLRHAITPATPATLRQTSARPGK
jgi:hypothetical protein